MKLIILLTDGQQNPTSEGGITYDPVVSSKKLYDSGVHIFSVGISDHVDEAELLLISRNRDNFFFAENFDILASSAFFDKITNKICKPKGKISVIIAPNCT